MLVFDPDGRGAITEKRQYVFTEWGERRKRNGPADRFRQRTREARAWTAKSDVEALRSYFDTNGDDKLTSADAAFASFKELATNADGFATVMTLTQLGITSINLTEDSTKDRAAERDISAMSDMLRKPPIGQTPTIHRRANTRSTVSVSRHVGD